MATTKKTATKAAVQHHRTWLIPLILVLVGLGVGLYFISTRTTAPMLVQTKSFIELQKPIETQLPAPISKAAREKFNVEQYNDRIQSLIVVVTPTVSLLSILGGLILLILNIVKAIRNTKNS
jgi:hypothetical protein